MVTRAAVNCSEIVYSMRRNRKELNLYQSVRAIILFNRLIQYGHPMEKAQRTVKNFWENAITSKPAVAHLQISLLLSVRNAQKIEPATAWAGVSYSSANIRHS